MGEGVSHNMRQNVRNVLRGAWCVVAAAALTGCMGPKFDTPSGRPEVTVAFPRAAVKGALVNLLAGQQLMVVQESDYLIVAEGKVSEFGKVMFTNTRGEQPHRMYRFMLADVPDGTRVIGQAYFLMPAVGLSATHEDDQNDWKDGDYVASILSCLEPNLKRAPK